MGELVLQMRGISKCFDTVTVLHDVDFDIEAGEVHALVGANGAGKSTLVKVLQGLHSDYGGRINIRGRAVQIRTPKASQAVGIGVVSQELSLLDELSIADNLFLGMERAFFGGSLFVRRRAAARAAAEKLSDFGLKLDPRTRVGDLSLGDKQHIEIIKGLNREASIMALDEPTAALSRSAAERLHDTVRSLKKQGKAIILISHRFEDITAISDRVTVLRNGRVVLSGRTDTVTEESLLAAMFDHTLSSFARAERSPEHQRLPLQCPVEIRTGETLGFHGQLSTPWHGLLRSLFGATPSPRSSMSVEDKSRVSRSPREAIRKGIGFLSADRRRDGIFPTLSVRDNMTLPLLHRLSRFGFVRRGEVEALFREAVHSLDIKFADPAQPASTLSGGNQQKLILARWLSAHAKILLFEEPTRGVDTQSKFELYRIIEHMKDDGKACLVVTSDIDELVKIADRIATMRDEKIHYVDNGPNVPPERTIRELVAQ